jgi:hypothetical protein
VKRTGSKRGVGGSTQGLGSQTGVPVLLPLKMKALVLLQTGNLLLLLKTGKSSERSSASLPRWENSGPVLLFQERWANSRPKPLLLGGINVLFIQ